MYNKLLSLFLCGALAVSLGACGSSSGDVKTITKEETKEAAEEEAGEKTVLKGYLFNPGGGDLGVDMPMEDALAILGEEKDYFEAASCAFEGQLDKTYTYDHFEVKTYPNEDGSKDFVSYINLFDDTVATVEGLYIGDPAEKAVELYGEDYTESGTAYVYEKDGMKLQLLLEDGSIMGITYLSSILEQ